MDGGTGVLCGLTDGVWTEGTQPRVYGGFVPVVIPVLRTFPDEMCTGRLRPSDTLLRRTYPKMCWTVPHPVGPALPRRESGREEGRGFLERTKGFGSFCPWSARDKTVGQEVCQVQWSDVQGSTKRCRFSVFVLCLFPVYWFQGCGPFGLQSPQPPKNKSPSSSFA